MAAPHTRRKSKIKYLATPAETQHAENAVDSVVKYVADWKLREIELMISSTGKNQLPVCLPVRARGYVVGKQVIRQSPGNTWDLIERNCDVTHTFNSKITAMAYSLCDQRGQSKLAKTIFEHDVEIAKYQQKLEHFQQSLTAARKKKDYWRVDLFLIMSESVEFQLEEAKFQLQKSLKLTKYFKIWE